MAPRWTATAFLEAKKFRRISGHHDVWILAAPLGRVRVDVDARDA
jgi:hypothetical protein